MWKALEEAISTSQLPFTIHNIRIPGFGGMEHQELPNLTKLAEMINEYLIQKGIKKAAFIGHSMGGYTLMEFLAKFPERIQSLCFLNSSIYADNDEKRHTRKKVISFIEKNGAEAFIKSFIPNLFGKEKHFEEVIENLIKEAKSFSSETLIHYMKAMADRNDNSKLLAKSDIPVHFIIGKEDQSIAYENAKNMISVPPKSTALIFNKGAHMSIFENTEDTCASIIEHLKLD